VDLECVAVVEGLWDCLGLGLAERLIREDRDAERVDVCVWASETLGVPVEVPEEERVCP
jgi:hypothetical protein